MSRGIRQGCPISALLFILLAEVLADNIRNNDSIKGLWFSGSQIKISQYADDTCLFLRDEISLKNILKLFDCAGLWLNKSKTELLLLGKENT